MTDEGEPHDDVDDFRWISSVVEPAAAAVSVSEDTPQLEALVGEWLSSSQPVELLLARISDESVASAVRALAVLLVVIEVSNPGRDVVMDRIARHAPSLAGVRMSRALDLGHVALAMLLIDLDVWSTRPTAPSSQLLDRLEHDAYPNVTAMCALAAAMMGAEDVVVPALQRKLRTAVRAAPAACSALGLALCSDAERVQDDLWRGARTDPHEDVRAACYAGLAIVGCDVSEGLFDVHHQVRGLAIIFLRPPLTAQQRSRLGRVMRDKTLEVEERLTAAASLVSEEEGDDLYSQIVEFLTTSDAPQVSTTIAGLIAYDDLNPAFRAQLTAALATRTDA